VKHVLIAHTQLVTSYHARHGFVVGDAFAHITHMNTHAREDARTRRHVHIQEADYNLWRMEKDLLKHNAFQQAEVSAYNRAFNAQGDLLHAF
jgi:hypothetical protein